MKAHHNIIKGVCTFTLLGILLSEIPTNAQPDTARTDMIAVSTRPYADSIILRWAPLTFSAWRTGNDEGYRIERYLIARNGSLISGNTRRILENSVRPYDEARWTTLVRQDRYAAIAAQALFGDRFEVDLNQSDVLSIVNKVKENEQRFTFALFCADVSPVVAKASGLWYVDKSVKPTEKYLYRIIANGSEDIRGSAFVGTGDDYSLPEPQNLKGEFRDGTASLRWDRGALTPYTAFSVERSVDGVTFLSVSGPPIVTLSPEAAVDSRYQYATDTLPDDSRIYHYRVRGITPFGEQGPASNTVRGQSISTLEQVPYISSATSWDNASILIKWEFPQTSNAAIAGFQVERSPGPAEKFVALNKQLLPPAAREFEDATAGLVNYYRIQAHGLDGTRYPSHVYFAQLVDSIPPVAPTALNAIVDDDGGISLTWKSNSEQDIYGYRIYRSYQLSEEPAQITVAPVRSNQFFDTVNLHTLNENVYYRLMAVDINQNHSSLSDVLEVTLPDKVRPQPPVLLPGRSEPGGVVLSWMPGASTDIVAYKIYRKADDEAAWIHLRTEASAADSVYRYVDSGCPQGKQVYYTVLSVDDAGLESVPADPVARACTPFSLATPPSWRKPTVIRDQNQVKLAWRCDHSAVASFRVFRSVNGGPPVLLSSPAGKEREYLDTIMPGTTYNYRIMASFETGWTSALSDELKLEF